MVDGKLKNGGPDITFGQGSQVPEPRGGCYARFGGLPSGRNDGFCYAGNLSDQIRVHRFVEFNKDDRF